jgi:hypothetical protein
MDKPKGSMHCRKTKPPGCGGFFIGMALFLSVVVDVIRADGDGPETFQIALERMQPKARQVHVLNRSGGIQARKNITQLHRLFGVYAALVVLFVQAFQTL